MSITAETEQATVAPDPGWTVFHQPWWLEAVAPGHWGETSIEDGGRPIARLPFVIRRQFGMTSLISTGLTPRLGPWLEPSLPGSNANSSQQYSVMTELIERLPEHDRFAQNFAPEIDNWLPFYWKGFEQTTRYTYRLDLTNPLNSIWDSVRGSVRRNVRKARKTIEVSQSDDVEQFMRLDEMTFRRQGMQLPYSQAQFRRLDAACAKRNARRIFVANAAGGGVDAALYVVMDSAVAYYLKGGSDPDRRSSGAMSLLMWSAIEHAHQHEGIRLFDFEGSMHAPIERFFRSFGATCVPYFYVTSQSARFRRMHGVGTMLRRARRRWWRGGG